MSYLCIINSSSRRLSAILFPNGRPDMDQARRHCYVISSSSLPSLCILLLIPFLTSSLRPGNTTIVLVDAVTWVKGQQIVIASSDENSANTEVATITYVAPDRKTFNISIPLRYKHWGQVIQKNENKETRR